MTMEQVGIAIWTNSWALVPHPRGMHFDPSSLEVQLQVYMQVQQVSNDTDLLIWWKQHQQELQEFPDLARMARQLFTSIS